MMLAGARITTEITQHTLFWFLAMLAPAETGAKCDYEIAI